MGERRFLLVLVLALVVAGGSGYGVYTLVQRVRRESQIPMAPIVVAVADLPEGHKIVPVDVQVVSVPLPAVPVGAFSVLDSVIDRVTRVQVFAGETLVPGRLAPEGTGAGIEVKIAPGKRAMAVQIDEVAGLAGLIQPNSRVDVVVTVTAEGDSQRRAKLIMSNMRVLSIGSQVERGPDGTPVRATTAALEVTPEEAEELAIAANQGRIQLVLRGYGDPDTVRTRGKTVRDVLQDAGGSAGGTAMGTTTSAPRTTSSSSRRQGTTSRAPQTAESPPASVVSPSASPPRRPDSSVVQVYRRSQMSSQKIARQDTIPPRP